MYKKSLLALAVSAYVISPITLHAEGASDLALTVYSSADPAGFDPQQFVAQQQQGYSPSFAWSVPGFGVVKETRSIELRDGVQSLPFSDVAQFIDPTSVSFTDLGENKATVLEQNFKFDLVNPDKLLQRYLDHEIQVVVQKGDSTELVSGKLLSAQPGGGQIVIQTSNGVELLNRYNPQLKLGAIPEGLITKPTLMWKVAAKGSGIHNIRAAYQTAGLTWRSDYNLVVNGSETSADLSAWVTLLNVSGATFKNSTLKLVAGDVQRVSAQGNTYQILERRAKSLMAADAMGEASGFEEKPFFEYHLYTLPVKTDILSNSTQQITLFPTASGVKTEKLLVYYGLPQASQWYLNADPVMDRNVGNQSNHKLDIYLKVANEEKNHLGMPLPRGKVRVFKQDNSDGSLEFIGEDLIDHTARDEKLLIKLGQSFDVVGERTQTNFSADYSGKTMTESFKIKIKNHKDAAQRVLIKENLFRWVNWSIIEKSDEFEKADARTIHFTVDVPARGEKVVTYTVKYTW